ncbi:MAG: SCO1664 family protein [Candidatus Dormibacteria bacterium]
MISGDPAPGQGKGKLARLLQLSPILRLERMPWGSNAVFLAHLEGTEGEVRAVYKPARGERPLWDFPLGTLHRREVATGLVDRALGWCFTPVTVLRAEGPFGVGSIQEFIEEPAEGLALDGAAIESHLRGLAALDVLVNNADRKRSHLLVDPEGHLRGIDHGVTFHTEFKLRTALIELGGTRVPEVWLRAVSGLLQQPPRLRSLRRDLQQLLRPAEVRAFEARAEALVESGTYPELHGFYGRPFEW